MPNNPLAYASYGGGVNSTAMILLIMEDERFADLREGLRIAFADTGAELPETLCYVQYFGKVLRERYGLELDTVSGGNLIDDCREKRIIPSFSHRWCTDRYKTQPLNTWAKETGRTLSLIGIDDGERHRAERFKRHRGVVDKRFPLIEAGMDRDECVAYIVTHGLTLPEKSGCWICPFAPKRRWEELLTKRPDLFEQACRLEENASGFARGYYLKSKPLRQWIATHGFDFGEPCAVCELS